MTRQKSLFAKVMALCLALAMTLSVAVVPVSAAIVENQTGTVTVNGLETDAGEVVDLYKVMDVHFDVTNQQPTEPVYTWIDQIAGWVRANYPAYIDTTTNAVTEDFSNVPASGLRTFYDALEDELLTAKVPPIGGQQTFTETDTSLEFTNVPMGQYLAVVSNLNTGHVHTPAVVNLVPEYVNNVWVLNPVEVSIKGDHGGIIEKDVIDSGDNTVKVGDIVEYRLDSVIPNYPEDTDTTKTVYETFEIADKLSDGLTLDKTSIVVKAGKTPNDPDMVTLTEGTHYTLTFDTSVTVGATTKPVSFIVRMNDEDYWDVLAAAPNATHVYVEYEATVNEKAFTADDLGNEAFVGINTDPYDNSSYDIDTVEKIIYTYGAEFQKVDGDNNNAALSGAEFKLYSDAACTAEIKFVKVSDGIYRVATTAETPAATLAVDANGKLVLQGLDAATYYLKEVKAPAGYNLLKDAVAFTITDANLDGTVDGNTAGDNILNVGQIQNTKGFELPVTGGMGTVVFTAVGIVLMAGGLLLIVAMKKKSTQK